MNIEVQIFLHDSAFSSFGYIPKREIVGSGGNSIFNLGGFRAVSHSDCIILHSHRQCSTVPISPRLFCGIYFHSLDSPHPSECEVEPHGSFHFFFLSPS